MMRLLASSHIVLLLATGVLAQHGVVLRAEDTTVTSGTGTPANGLPTESVTYASYESTVTLATATDEAISTETGNSTETATSSESTDTVTLLVGGKGKTTITGTGGTATESGNATETSSTATAVPTNTRPCNGYPEFCERPYSNITQVAAHNSPFVRTGNAASNQFLPVTTQLNDGIRMRKLLKLL